ncbi:hypothetical protein U0070_021011 [Myodes glareolus]|uniref:Intracellular hyaluronan-binding protein 4 N-terminal domain-containing protein n=1 Tax=Myodes glareolus TaxID=447135 RepID=A0AAW0GXU6_MYOGA
MLSISLELMGPDGSLPVGIPLTHGSHMDLGPAPAGAIDPKENTETVLGADRGPGARRQHGSSSAASLSLAGLGCPRRPQRWRHEGGPGEPGGRRGRHDAGDVRLRRGQRLLLDDESDPFDILREAEHRRQQQLQRKRRDEAAEAASGVGHRGGRSPAVASGHRPGAAGRRESQKERKSLVASSAQQPDNPGGPQPPGQKRTPRRGEQQGWNDNRGTDALDRAERRSYREYRLYDTERKADLASEKFTDEKPVDRFDRDRPLRGRGGPRGGLRSRGRDGPGNRAFDSFDQRGK